MATRNGSVPVVLVGRDCTAVPARGVRTDRAQVAAATIPDPHGPAATQTVYGQLNEVEMIGAKVVERWFH